VAELKHDEIARTKKTAAEFPRLQRRGRIEAGGHRHSCSSSRVSFHGFNAVAELKLGVNQLVGPWGDGVSTASTPWPN